MLPLIELLIFRIALCSAPPSPLNGSVQADDGRTYVEGDEVNFQCLSVWPADVLTTTCTMEGNWWPDPQLLESFSLIEGLSAYLPSRSLDLENIVAEVVRMMTLVCGLVLTIYLVFFWM